MYVCSGVVSTWCASLMCETSAMTVEPSAPKGDMECKHVCVCVSVRACVFVRVHAHIFSTHECVRMRERVCVCVYEFSTV